MWKGHFCGTGILPVTGKMPVPQVSPLKCQHYKIASFGLRLISNPVD